MSSRSTNVLVFGATGGVGSAAAIQAHKQGAHVWLAMRDTSKTIRGLDADSERYTRVQADLSAPDSLKSAVEQSGATTAFVYVIHTSSDHMRSAFEALKAAGLKYVVLLSTYTITGSARDESNQVEFIPRSHALAENALEDSGLAFAALRPAYFNTNVFGNLDGLKKGDVGLLYPDIKFDFLSPTDIGTTAGTLLVGESKTKVVYLVGPGMHTQRESVEIIGKVVGRDIKVREIDEAAYYEQFNFMPRPILETLVTNMRKSNEGHNSYPKQTYEEGLKNLAEYTDNKPTTFAAWVEANKGAFA